ncbi:Uncharacterised protein [Burkholderia pseudomallei]|nr:Uncharacterised protein [Burkholderia pseudomallei]
MPPSSQNDAIVSCPNSVAISEVCAPELGFCICTLLKPATSSRYVPIASAAQNTVDAAMPSTSPITSSRSLDSASSTMKRMNSSPRCCSAKMS